MITFWVFSALLLSHSDVFPVSRLVPWCSANIAITYCASLFGDPHSPSTTPRQVHHPPTARVSLSGGVSSITLARLQVYLHLQFKYSSIIISLLTRYILRGPLSTPDLLDILTQCTHITDDDLSLSSPSLHKCLWFIFIIWEVFQKLQIFSKKMASYFTTILGRSCSKSKLLLRV